MNFNWSDYIRKDGHLNTNKFKCLLIDPMYISIQQKYYWADSIAEVYYCDKNNILEQPKCEYCGKITKYLTGYKSYQMYCSMLCSSNGNLEQRKITCLHKYGEDNPAKVKLFKDNIKSTNIIKYGFGSYNQKHYTDEQWTKLNDKEWLTNQHHVMRKPLSQISKEIGLPKNGSTLCKWFKKHNIEQIHFNDWMRDGKNHNQKHYTEDQWSKLNDKEWLILQHHTLEKPLSQISKEIGLPISGSTVSKYFRIHKIEVLQFKRSQGEKELFAFIQECYGGIVLHNDHSILPYHDKRGYVKYRELDIYIPELNLAFEYDGEHWHKDRKHLDKLKDEQCKEIGIELYRISDKEWTHECEQIKYRIIEIINKNAKYNCNL